MRSCLPLSSASKKEPSDVTIEDPDERNEDYLSRIRLELPDKHFLGVIAECVRENYCNARVFFVKKGYAPIDGVVDGNVWGVVLSGALDDVYRIAKKLKHPGVSVEPEMNIKKRSTKYSHLRLVE